MRVLVFPLLVLGALASYLAGVSFATRWHTPFPLEYLFGGALHAAWLAPAARRSGLLLVAVCWITSVALVRRGLASLYVSGSDFLLAVLLEGICLLLALSIAPKESWGERLAQWRRNRTEIATQLRMAEGILPWSRLCFRHLTTSAADTPMGSDYHRFAAALADAEHRLRVRLTRIAMPEQLRQSILENVSAITARAETVAAQRSIELEQQALAAASVCRDQCEHMDHLPAPQRKALAAECEQVFLELTRY